MEVATLGRTGLQVSRLGAGLCTAIVAELHRRWETLSRARLA